MAYKYKSNVAKIKADNNTNLPLALRFMLEDIDKLAFPRTPKDTGNLQRNVLKQVLGKTGIITWATEYATYQEDNQYVNYTTPGTGPHFAEDSVKEVVDHASFYFDKARLT